MAKVGSHILSHLVTVLRSTKAADGQGGYTETWQPVNSALRCRLTDTKLVNRIDETGMLRADVTRILYAAPDENLKAGDRVEFNGVSWSVQSADTQADGIYLKAYLLAEQPS